MAPRIGVQLYSVRDALAEDFPGTMRRIADIGFTGVETAFFGDNTTAKEARSLFDEMGLSVIAAHCPLPEEETEQIALTLLNDLQCPRGVWHGWPEEERYRTLEGIQSLAAQYNRENAVCRAHGITLGLHNHWWEFQTVGDRTAMAHLLPLIDGDIILELDTYWLKTAGQDPAQIIAEVGTRAPLIHLKDGPATVEALMEPIGTGSMDTLSIVHAARSTAEWLIVELDNVEGDIFDALSQSYQYLAKVNGNVS